MTVTSDIHAGHPGHFRGRSLGRASALAVAAALLLPGLATSQPARPEAWVGAWGYAPTPQQPGLPNSPAPNAMPTPLSAPAPAAAPTVGSSPLLDNPDNLPVDLSTTGDLSNVTIRQVVRVSAAGPRLRLRFSNESGGAPLVIGACGWASPGQTASPPVPR